ADFGEGGGFDHPVADGAFDFHGRQHALRDGKDLIDVGQERELEGGKRASAADDVAVNRRVLAFPDVVDGHAAGAGFDAAVEVAEVVDVQVRRLEADVQRARADGPLGRGSGRH